MTEFTSEPYFNWLCSHIAFPKGDKTYIRLLELMHEREFVWVPGAGNDENRIGDGRDLRNLYLDMIDPDGRDRPDIHSDPVSVLEVLIGLSARLAWLAEGDSRDWAWKLIKNLGLQRYHDPITARKAGAIDAILETLIFRTYEYDGSGGFFPLLYPRQSQPSLEIWYQMAAYIEEFNLR